MQLTGRQMPFGPSRRHTNPWRVLVYLVLIMAGVIFTRMVESQRVQRPFVPTPTPTRVVLSYVEEAQTYFSVGDLESTIEAYRKALEVDPENARLYAEMARVQTYSSELRTNSTERQARMAEARASIDRGTELTPDDSMVQAVRSLVYDWSAFAIDDAEVRLSFLTEAETAAVYAKQLDPANVLADAYYAEVLVDQRKWAQAMDVAEQTVEAAESRNDISDLMRLDIYRVYAVVLENNGYYYGAIDAYLKALEYAPSLTFLYLNLGTNYRQLKLENPEYLEMALDSFARAAQINEQLGIEDPVPYLAIGKTYMQEGEFFAAALNISKALQFDSTDPDIYGRLGLVYFKARNYESSLDVLQCAVQGCDAEVNRSVLCEALYGCDPEDPEALQYGEEITGLILDSNSVVYYYTYASALAYYGMCDEAEVLFRDLNSVYPNDAIVQAIIAENRAICSDAEVAGDETAAGVVEPTESAVPAETEILTPTATPSP
ncbi:MAG: tetratricopeptide repeat protein [Anaerolineales bacterium]|nr:tetratricopeptide repeat protein [Anaerolineales bacterium]